MAHKYPTPSGRWYSARLVTTTLHSSTGARRWARSPHGPNPITNQAPLQCSSLAPSCSQRVVHVTLFPLLPLSRAKSFSGKGVALTSELIPTYPACFSDSCSPIMLVEWTPSLHVAVYEPKECWIYESCQFLKLLMLPSQWWHSTLDRLPSDASLNLPKGLLKRKSGFTIQKPSNATSTNHCQLHFGRASRWPSPSLYRGINKDGSYYSGKCIWVLKTGDVGFIGEGSRRLQ